MNMGKMYRLIVFDWDGTLADSTARIVASLRHTLAELSCPVMVEQTLKDVIGLGMTEAIQALLPGADGPLIERFTAVYRHHYLTVSWTPTQLFPDALSTLQALDRQGYWLAVATGKGRRGLDRSLEETGVKSLLSMTRCVDECPSKPHPQMLLDIMDGLAIAAEHTLMIGDSAYDLQMADNAGVDAIAVTYGAHEAGRLSSCAPMAMIDRLADVLVSIGPGPLSPGPLSPDTLSQSVE